MDKQQFIKAFADKAQFTQKDAGIAFDAMVETIADVLREGEKIKIAGFGTFEMKKREARDGINPMTKEKVKISASNVPNFKFGDSFKKSVNS